METPSAAEQIDRIVQRIKPRPTWQPIETAPRDGDRVLLYEGFEPYTGQGSWSEESGEWVRDYHQFWKPPTHWMPLPDPPA